MPPLACLVLAALVQHACELLGESMLPGFWLHLDALYLVFPLLYLRFAHGLPQVAFTALMLDAMWPGPFGTRLVLYSLALAMMIPLRVRVRRENPLHVFWLASGMNLFVFAGFWLQTLLGPDALACVPLTRILTDLLVSELLVGFSAYWWMEFQRLVIFRSCGQDPAGFPIL